MFARIYSSCPTVLFQQQDRQKTAFQKMNSTEAFWNSLHFIINMIKSAKESNGFQKCSMLFPISGIAFTKAHRIIFSAEASMKTH